MTAKIYGRRYSEEAQYYTWDADRLYPFFKKEDEQTWEIKVRSLDDGERWLAKNHPDMYMGGSVVCENGDFTCLAVPCTEYGEGNYETIQARVAYVKSIFGE